MEINDVLHVCCLRTTDCTMLFPSRLERYPALSLIKITPSQPMEVNAFPRERTNREGLSILKAFSHCRTNLQHYCPDQGRFCSNSKAKDDVVNRYPRVSQVHSILVALGAVNYLQGFSIHNFMVREVTAEHADFFFFFSS